MIEAGINDGDYVVVKEQPVANNGDIVVAIIDDGATVKRFFKESDHIRLQPENSTMDPIITTDCAIAGKVVAVFRACSGEPHAGRQLDRTAKPCRNSDRFGRAFPAFPNVPLRRFPLSPSDKAPPQTRRKNVNAYPATKRAAPVECPGGFAYLRVTLTDRVRTEHARERRSRQHDDARACSSWVSDRMWHLSCATDTRSPRL